VSFWRYVLVVTTIVLVSLGLLLTLLGTFDPRTRLAILAGSVLATLNTVVAYGLVRWSRNRSPTAFMGAVLGGMVGRMGVMLGAIALGVLFFGLPKIPLAVSLLAYFVLFLLFELAQLHGERGAGAHPA
jgi:hypothetical protein